MPLRHGLDVSVITPDFNRFTEYGVSTHARSKLVTAKLEAKTGAQFQISIRPERLFPTEQNKRQGLSILTRAQERSRSDSALHNSTVARRRDTARLKISGHNVDTRVEERLKELHLNDEDSHTPKPPSTPKAHHKLSPRSNLSSALTRHPMLLPRPIPPSTLPPKPTPAYKAPPFDLLAEVFIDGRSKAETRCTIYLDPASCYYHPCSLLEGRRVKLAGKNGRSIRTCVHDWVFTDAGIEVLLERMGVEDDTGKDGREDGDQEMAGLADLLQDTANVNSEEGAEQQELKIGKIEVRFTRIVLGEFVSVKSTTANGRKKEARASTKRVVGKDVTHTTSIIRPNTSSTGPKRILVESKRVKWTTYNPSEDFYAKFIFDYTSRAKLVKWGLCDEAGVPVVKKEMASASSCRDVAMRAEDRRVRVKRKSGGGDGEISGGKKVRGRERDGRFVSTAAAVAAVAVNDFEQVKDASGVEISSEMADGDLTISALGEVDRGREDSDDDDDSDDDKENDEDADAGADAVLADADAGVRRPPPRVSTADDWRLRLRPRT